MSVVLGATSNFSPRWLIPTTKSTSDYWEWVGGPFNAQRFYLDAVNLPLSKIKFT
jgi:hypothetical protein